MSTENTTYALQVAATNGGGFSVIFREANFVTFRVIGNGSVSAGQIAIECCPGNMALPPSAETTGATWTTLTVIAVPAKDTIEYSAGLVSGTNWRNCHGDCRSAREAKRLEPPPA